MAAVQDNYFIFVLATRIYCAVSALIFLIAGLIDGCANTFTCLPLIVSAIVQSIIVISPVKHVEKRITLCLYLLICALGMFSMLVKLISDFYFGYENMAVIYFVGMSFVCYLFISYYTLRCFKINNSKRGAI